MAGENEKPLSPTVIKVLDTYVEALLGDADIEKEAANRLNELLRKGNIPKSEDIDAALFPSQEDEKQ